MNQLKEYLSQRKTKRLMGTTSPLNHPLKDDYHYTKRLRKALSQLDAFWLLDEIISLQKDDEVQAQEQQLWELDTQYGLAEHGRLNLLLPNGEVEFMRRIKYLEFPLDRIEIQLIGKVFSLPQEQ